MNTLANYNYNVRKPMKLSGEVKRRLEQGSKVIVVKGNRMTLIYKVEHFTVYHNMGQIHKV